MEINCAGCGHKSSEHVEGVFYCTRVDARCLCLMFWSAS